MLNIPSELSYLYHIGQEHLLAPLSKWPVILQKQFVKQMSQFSVDLFEEQQTSLQSVNRLCPPLQNPYEIMERTKTLYDLGKSMLEEKRVGLILLAGGHGSRLGFPRPKGCIPLPKLQNRTLLSILLNKCVSLQKTISYQLPIAIMTSSDNYFFIHNYLKQQDFFSLSREQITIFPQKSFPLLDRERNWFIQSPGLLAQGPGGNGAAFGEGMSILQKWKIEGIEWVQVIPIDNPLSIPFDPYLLGCHLVNQSDLALLTIQKNPDITEVGLIGQNNGNLYIQEYLDPELQTNLLFVYIGVFSCSIDLALQWKNSLPWHAVQRKGYVYHQKGYQEMQEVWKLEKFLFDIFPLSHKYSILLGKKEFCFAPIKSLQGRYSLELAQNYFLQYENFAKQF